MESGAWQLVSAAFQNAMDLPADRRSAFLDTLDAAVREEVLALLASLDPSAGIEPHRPSAGLTLGPYETVELIGQGGMGAVFRAVRRDGDFSQEVALKIISGHAFDKAAEERFRAERRILARLQHPHIVRLLDGGIDQGKHYFVMELLRGETITGYCRRRGLPAEAIVSLFLQVAGAIQCAHRNLIIHRDLKPSNILVTADGVAKVLDFGVAKLIGPEPVPGEAVTNARAMSLDCASPELVRGEPVTTAADVYSLGLLLYQLLTRVNPQPCGECSLDEALRVICERDPVRPSTLVPGLDRDLEAIVMKAIAKPVLERYASVERMMDDLQAFLERRPVSARKVTAAYLAGRFVARHRWPVAAAAAILLTAVSGVAAVLWQANRTAHQRRLAERRFDYSRRLIQSLVVDLQEKLRGIPATVSVRKSLVGEAVKYLEELSVDAEDRAGLLLEIATAYGKLAELEGSASESSLGDVDAADRMYRKGLALVETLLARAPNHAGAVIAASRLHTGLGFSQSKRMTPEERLAHQAKAAEFARRARTLGPLDRPSREFLASSYFYTATARLGQPDELDYWNKALELYLALHNEAPHPNRLRNVSLVRKNLGGYWSRAGQPAKALAEAQLALAMDRELLLQTPDDQRTRLDVAIDHNEVAVALRQLGREAEAVLHARESAGIRAGLAERNPLDARFQDRYAFSLFSLAAALRRSDPKAAAGHAGQAIRIWRKLSPPGSNAVYEMQIAKTKVVLGAARTAAGGNGCRLAAEGRAALLALEPHLKGDASVSELLEDAANQLRRCR